MIPAEYVAACCWTALCFLTGVSWSAYRAVGWVERIRLWASTVEVPAQGVVDRVEVPAATGVPSGR